MLHCTCFHDNWSQERWKCYVYIVYTKPAGWFLTPQVQTHVSFCKMCPPISCYQSQSKQSILTVKRWWLCWCLMYYCQWLVTNVFQSLLLGSSIYVIGASLSEPHTSVTALLDVCVCMSVCVRPYTENLNWANRFQICTCAKTNSCSVN